VSGKEAPLTGDGGGHALRPAQAAPTTTTAATIAAAAASRPRQITSPSVAATAAC